MNPLDLVIRSLYYFRNGYGIYLSLPLTLVSFTTTVYYLAIQNVPFLKGIFPSFVLFGVVLTLFIYPAGVLIGWIHFKKMRFYRIEQEIQVESNPYSQDRLAPVMIPMWKMMVELGKREGIDVSEMEKILRKSV